MRIHDALTGGVLRTFDEEKDFLHAVAWSPQGDVVVSGCDDGTYTLRNPATGKLLRRWTAGAKRVAGRVVWGLRFSRDGTTLYATSGDGTLRAWDPATGTERWRIAAHAKRAVGIDLDPTGGILASGGGDAQVRLWDVATQKVLRTFGGHGKTVYAVAFHPTRALLASGGADGTVRIWNLAKGSLHQRLDDVGKDGVYGLAWRPGGDTLAASCGSGVLRLLGPVAPATQR